MQSPDKFRPMLAVDAPLDHYAKMLKEEEYLMASYKIDGIRAVIKDGKLLSRSLKPIPNVYVRYTLESTSDLEGFDGELVCGNSSGYGVFARSSSAFMSRHGNPHFMFHVFDCVLNPDLPFVVRNESATRRCLRWDLPYVTSIRQWLIRDVGQLIELEQQALASGYEGLIVRAANAPYKYGRSTLKQGWMLKLKRFEDSEAKIIGFEELMHNDNPATTDARGFSTRSSHQANQRPSGMLGALRVEDLKNRQWCFNIGSGFDHETRRRIWDSRDRYIGRVVKYKYLAHGMVDVPRHPIFLGFRSPEDM